MCDEDGADDEEDSNGDQRYLPDVRRMRYTVVCVFVCGVCVPVGVASPYLANGCRNIPSARMRAIYCSYASFDIRGMSVIGLKIEG